MRLFAFGVDHGFRGFLDVTLLSFSLAPSIPPHLGLNLFARYDFLARLLLPNT